MTTVPPADDAVSVRQATPGDLLRVHRIEQVAFPQPWPMPAFENYLEEPGFLVAEGDSGVVGYVVADAIPNHGTPLGHVKDIAVAPDRRGEGIGRSLLDSALETLREGGAGSVKLEVRASNDVAISLYREFDFEHQRTIPNYYGNGEDALVMVRGLD
ncbi:ribosomal protein S18-alanine N-acetyltransferase [Halomicrobium urmianum]|uniref:ribosomal protein S18-alanine N-acetyltransferase n=1 Tax=Halomicrobium urmianum TaxID=1586233 RepID=UPI001CD9C8D0|nr:ribosomal protein S18-alanine N-acetyltransferase [Halomicrobium urmianum]